MTNTGTVSLAVIILIKHVEYHHWYTKIVTATVPDHGQFISPRLELPDKPGKPRQNTLYTLWFWTNCGTGTPSELDLSLGGLGHLTPMVGQTYLPWSLNGLNHCTVAQPYHPFWAAIYTGDTLWHTQHITVLMERTGFPVSH